MPQLVDLNLLVERFKPVLNFCEQPWLNRLRKSSLVLPKWDFGFELLCERQIDGENRSQFIPLRLTRAVGSWRGNLRTGKCFVHVVVTHGHGPFSKRTATAF